MVVAPMNTALIYQYFQNHPPLWLPRADFDRIIKKTKTWKH